MSVSNDLRVDAERDLRDVGLDRVKVHSLNKASFSCQVNAIDIVPARSRLGLCTVTSNALTASLTIAGHAQRSWAISMQLDGHSHLEGQTIITKKF